MLDPLTYRSVGTTPVVVRRILVRIYPLCCLGYLWTLVQVGAIRIPVSFSVPRSEVLLVLEVMMASVVVG